MTAIGANNPPRKPVKFGGLTIDENQVKSKRVESGIGNKKTYVVQFKTGVTARYERQNYGAGLNSVPSQYNNMSADKVIDTEGWNLKGLSIEGSNKRDSMIFHDCEDVVVNNYLDRIKDSCIFDGGKNNSHFDK